MLLTLGMCFSAEASFVASATLSVCGVMALKQAATPRQGFFAAIPLIFAAQQFSEGMIWLKLHAGADPELVEALSRLYLAFAWVIWPFYLPFSVRLLESRASLRPIQNFLLFLGSLVTIVLAFALFHYPLYTSISNHHLHYQMPADFDYPVLLAIAYFIPVGLTLFFSSSAKLRWLGATGLISFALTAGFYRAQLISVWCFFAAICSAGVLIIVWQWQRQLKSSPD